MSFVMPLQDVKHALYGMSGISALEETGAFEDLSDDLIDAILTEMGKFCEQEIAPLNEISDQHGAKLENGVVRTTPGFAEAYKAYVEGGWGSLNMPVEYGGQGLPTTLAVAFVDCMNAACMSFAIGSTLTTGAVKAIMHAGTDAQKAFYLPKLISAEWAGTMNLTESQAGSDLALVRAKAEPIGDGKYKITGQKIFITYGDHELAENIVHLVLARLPDAPVGVAGISMFIVSKHHLDAEGNLSERNDVHCVSLEHKMGLHGSPTCVMQFGDNGECIGELLGEEHKGLRNMFVMMNSARLDVGTQGVGIAERAYQRALAYAQERKQGRSVTTGQGPVEIIEHPDVRRMLYSMKVLTEASRGICYATAVAYDMAHYAPDEDVRKKASAREGLLIPIAKAWSTDRANDVTSIGVQVHGGMGYIEETGAAQHMRDARIAAIYEGTNGIQAMDLVGRKLQGDGGAALQDFADEISEFGGQCGEHENPSLKAIGARLDDAVKAVRESAQWILSVAKDDQESVQAAATPFLKQFGNLVGGYYLTRGAFFSLQQDDSAVSAMRVQLAHFYADNYLTEAVGLSDAIQSGGQRVAMIPAALLSR